MVTATTSTVVSTTPPIVATAASPLPATATNTPVQAKVKPNLYTVDVVNVSSDSQTDGYQNMDNDVSDRYKRLTKKRPRFLMFLVIQIQKKLRKVLAQSQIRKHLKRMVLERKVQNHSKVKEGKGVLPQVMKVPVLIQYKQLPK